MKSKKSTTPHIVISSELNTIIGGLSNSANMHKKYYAEMLLRFAICVINQAKEQGIKDKNIADYLEYCIENEMTDTHIALMAQNFQDSLEAEEK